MMRFFLKKGHVSLFFNGLSCFNRAFIASKRISNASKRPPSAPSASNPVRLRRRAPGAVGARVAERLFSPRRAAARLCGTLCFSVFSVVNQSEEAARSPYGLTPSIMSMNRLNK